MKYVRQWYGLASCLTATALVAGCSPPETVSEEPALEESAHETNVEHTRHWGYGPDNGPASWADLNPNYALCRDGREQSPIDISDPSPAVLPGLAANYQAATMRIIRHEHVVDVVDNGHTIQVNYDEGSTLEVGDSSFELAQYHFHAPSEHTLDGRHSPMEMHLVHSPSRASWPCSAS